MEKAKVTLGHDAEFFIKVNGEFEPSDAILKDDFDKKELMSCYGGYPFSDGTQAELNVLADMCRERVAYMTHHALSILQKQMIDPKMVPVPVAVSAIPVSMEWLENHRAGMYSYVSGCKPDFCVYREGPNPRNEKFHELPYRCAGHHVHMSTETHHANPHEHIINLGKVLDRTVGLLTTALDFDETSKIRRKVCGSGMAGCYRAKINGDMVHFEYRVPSAYWLRHPFLETFLLGIVRVAVTATEGMYYKPFIDQITDKEVEEAINECDQAACINLFQRVMEPFIIASNTESYSPFSSREDLRVTPHGNTYLAPIEIAKSFMSEGWTFSEDLTSNWMLERNASSILASMFYNYGSEKINGKNKDK